MKVETAVPTELRLWPEEFESMRPEARTVIAAWAAANPRPPRPADPMERILQARATFDSLATGSPMAQARDIAGVPCRVFIPEGRARGVYLDIHGGGLVLGSARTDDVANEARSRDHGLVVVSVDYRLAPEFPFPAAPDDCFAVARWLCGGGAEELGSDRLLIGGDSAGAYLAAVTLLRVRDELGSARRFAAANLVFGIYDMGGTPSQRGRRAHGGFDVLDPQELDLVRDSFAPGLSNDERRAAAISPLYADLHDLPPALFTVGASDHVLDDSLFMANRWVAAGNRADLAVYPDCGHGFHALPIELGNRARARIEAFVSDALDPAFD
jgi:acetyl esterase/lipase